MTVNPQRGPAPPAPFVYDMDDADLSVCHEEAPHLAWSLSYSAPTSGWKGRTIIHGALAHPGGVLHHLVTVYRLDPREGRPHRAGVKVGASTDTSVNLPLTKAGLGGALRRLEESAMVQLGVTMEAYRPSIEVQECPRCGSHHPRVAFAPFLRPPDGAYDAFGFCCRTGEPILRRLEQAPEEAVEAALYYDPATDTLSAAVEEAPTPAKDDAL